MVRDSQTGKVYTEDYVRETLSAKRESVVRWVQDVALKKFNKWQPEMWDWLQCCKTVGLAPEWHKAMFQHHIVSMIKASGRQRAAAAEPPVTTQPSFESQQLGASSQEEQEGQRAKVSKAPQQANKRAKKRSQKNGKGAEDYHNDLSGEDESKEEDEAAAVRSNARGRPTRHAAAAAAKKIAASGDRTSSSPGSSDSGSVSLGGGDPPKTRASFPPPLPSRKTSATPQREPLTQRQGSGGSDVEGASTQEVEPARAAAPEATTPKAGALTPEQAKGKASAQGTPAHRAGTDATSPPRSSRSVATAVAGKGPESAHRKLLPPPDEQPRQQQQQPQLLLRAGSAADDSVSTASPPRRAALEPAPVPAPVPALVPAPVALAQPKKKTQPLPPLPTRKPGAVAALVPAADPAAPRKRSLQEAGKGQASAPPAKKVAAAPPSPSSRVTEEDAVELHKATAESMDSWENEFPPPRVRARSLNGAAPLPARGNAAQPRPAPKAPVSPARTVLDEQDAARSEQQLRRAPAGAPSTSAAPTPTPTPTPKGWMMTLENDITAPTPAIERTTTQATSALSRVAVKGSSLKPRKATSEYADASIVGVTRQGEQLVWSVLTCEELNDGAVLFTTEYMLRHHADLLVECAALYAESLPDLQNLPQRGNARR